MYLKSPDLAPGSWAAVQRGGPRPATVPKTPIGPAVSYCYNRSLALQGAHSNNPDCGTPYNWEYCNYNSCGGDCANYVSQCLRAGGFTSDNTWNTNQGPCPCSAGNTHGTYAWINNQGLRDWINTSGRGYPVGDPPDGQDGWMYVGNGDIINYKWQSVDDCDTGADVDHIVVVTGSNGNGPVICSHNADLCDFPWASMTCGTLTFRYATFSVIRDCF
ncbi:MAG TPA: amidase domain-containing protein [Thermomicrobiales bacterium]|nr:amidase domain-containing protein [Thermomicrobiales bacterium]